MSRGNASNSCGGLSRFKRLALSGDDSFTGSGSQAIALQNIEVYIKTVEEEKQISQWHALKPAAIFIAFVMAGVTNAVSAALSRSATAG